MTAETRAHLFAMIVLTSLTVGMATCQVWDALAHGGHRWVLALFWAAILWGVARVIVRGHRTP